MSCNRVIRAIIFDMDGVIVESEPAHIKAEKQTMLKHGVRISSEELHRYTGATARFMFEDLIKKYELNATFEEIFKEKEEILFKLLDEDTHPTNGVISLLEELKQADVRLAIASCAHRRLIKYVLDKLSIASFFDAVVGAEDVINGKPDPEIFLKAAKQLNFDPSECLVIEDSALGVKAAKKAGMKCAGYRNPSSGDQDLSEADLMIEDFSKIDVRELLS